MKRKNLTKWQQYEQAKAALLRQNLTSNEYERRLRAIARRLGV